MDTLTSEGSAATDPVEFAGSVRSDLASGARLQLRVNDETCVVEGAVADRLLSVLEALVKGDLLEIEMLPPVLTTGQAADLLGVSRPTVVSLIDSGRLPASRVGSHRRVEAKDLLAYRAQARGKAEDAMQELVAMSEDLGLYGDE